MAKTEKPPQDSAEEPIRWLEIEGVRFPVSPEQEQALQFVAGPVGEGFTLYECKCSACGSTWRFPEQMEDCAPCPACLMAVLAKRAAGGCQCYWEDDHTFMECEVCRQKRGKSDR